MSSFSLSIRTQCEENNGSTEARYREIGFRQFSVIEAGAQSGFTLNTQKAWGWFPSRGLIHGHAPTKLVKDPRDQWQNEEQGWAAFNTKFKQSPSARLAALGEWVYAPIPPWSTASLRSIPWRKPSFTECESHIADTFVLKGPYAVAEEHRLDAWRKVFQTINQHPYIPIHGRAVTTLLPIPLSIPPLQWAYSSSDVMLTSLADYPNISTTQPRRPPYYIDFVRTVIENYRLLQRYGHNLRDAGEAYALVRAHWKDGGFITPAWIAGQQEDDAAIRLAALQGGYIKNPRVPPRRVWDLVSNRVLPYYFIDLRSRQQLHKEIWTISHSWVDEDDRMEVWTSINAYQWPVPIPKTTTLDHIRVELLNLGAEYVWLDVLCLRQRGREEDEQQRKEEWQLDVPTIGHIYSLDAPCITYFNGLGIPFDPSPATLASPRHWFNRVWTVQEASSAWIPGGLTGFEKGAEGVPRDRPEWLRQEATSSSSGQASEDLKALLSEVSKNDGEDPVPEVCDFFYRRHANAIPADRRQLLSYWNFAIKAMKGRHCSTELDRVHALAYILKCDTLPIYDEQVSPDLAWNMLLKHLYPYVRNLLLLQHLKLSPSSTSLLPSLNEFMELSLTDEDHHMGWLFLLRPSRLGAAEPGIYYHEVEAFQPSFYLRLMEDGAGETFVVLVDAADASRSYTVGCYDVVPLEPQTKYRILKVDYRVWMVVEDVGLKVYDADDEEKGGRGALEARDVIKRGRILVRRIEKALPPCETMTVVYF